MGDRPHHSEIYDANADEWINSELLLAQRDAARASCHEINILASNFRAERDAALAERDKYGAENARLRAAERSLHYWQEENAALWRVAYAFNAFQKHPLIPRWDDQHMYQAPGSLWDLVRLGREALASLPKREGTE